MKSFLILLKFQPYKFAIYLSSALLIIVYIIGLIFYLPHADCDSIQNGFSVIAQILGVLLGVFIVLIILLIEQKQNAEKHLAAEFHNYKNLVKENFELIRESRKEIQSRINNGEFGLKDYLDYPDGAHSHNNFQDILGNLSALEVLIEPTLSDEIENELKWIGLTESERDNFLISKAISANYDPVKLLELVEEALDVNFLAPYCSNESSDLAVKVFEEFNQKGISAIKTI